MHTHTRMRARTRARSYCNELKTIPPLNPLVSLSVLGLYNNLLSSAELAGAPPCVSAGTARGVVCHGTTVYVVVSQHTAAAVAAGVSGNSR